MLGGLAGRGACCVCPFFACPCTVAFIRKNSMSIAIAVVAPPSPRSRAGPRVPSAEPGGSSPRRVLGSSTLRTRATPARAARVSAEGTESVDRNPEIRLIRQTAEVGRASTGNPWSSAFRRIGPQSTLAEKQSLKVIKRPLVVRALCSHCQRGDRQRLWTGGLFHGGKGGGSRSGRCPDVGAPGYCPMSRRRPARRTGRRRPIRRSKKQDEQGALLASGAEALQDRGVSWEVGDAERWHQTLVRDGP